MQNLSDHYKHIIELIGEDPSREGLQGTPERAASAICHLTQGYQEDLNEIINKHQPTEAAIEELFFFKNQKTIGTMSGSKEFFNHSVDQRRTISSISVGKYGIRIIIPVSTQDNEIVVIISNHFRN